MNFLLRRRYIRLPFLGFFGRYTGIRFIHNFCRNKFNDEVLELAPGESVAALEERVRESEMIMTEML